jgi:hypothetical protein
VQVPSLHHSARLRGRARAALVACLLGCSTATGVATLSVPPATAASRHPAELTISPDTYVGGQLLRWSGNIGHVGVRQVSLEYDMGWGWIPIRTFHRQTAPDGSFSFRRIAPSMMNIRYRVVAGHYATPARVFYARTQDLTIRKTGDPDANTNPPALVDPGETFGITVDTTPDNIFRSPGSVGLPVFEGRDLALQKRQDNGTWSTVAQGSVGADGLGSFSGLSEPAGVSVYRVREGNWFMNGNEIGWIPSFPLYVLSGPQAQLSYAALHANIGSQLPVSPPSRVGGGQAPTASQRFRWFPSLFDFGWESGQSLSSTPQRGTDKRGHWQEYTDGAGRVAKFNGGLALDSKRYTGDGPGDFGTTLATLRGNSMTQGRWETSLRIRNAFEDTGHPYGVRAELVPARADDYDCGAHNITVADISPFSRTMRFGVRSPRYAWSGSTTAQTDPRARAFNVAVEVAGKHITWFLDSKPVGSATSAAALPGVPLTLRLSLVGVVGQEMDQTGLISDWQRGFPISTGTQTVSSHRLQRTQAPKADCSAP